jgi:hypothetical protein
VDSDFAGLLSVEDKHQPISAKSRTGYIILYSGVPILWVSKMQTQNSINHYGGIIYCLVTIYERFNTHQRDPERNQSHGLWR